MKVFVFLFLSMTIGSLANAQWMVKDSQGDTLMIIQNDGNVGIQTSPRGPLDINGVIKVRENATINAIYVSDDNGVLEITTIDGDIQAPVSDMTVTGIQSRATSADVPSEGDILKWNSLQNQWLVVPDESAQNTGDAITSLGGTNGLTGYGTEGDITLDAQVDQPMWNAQALQNQTISSQSPATSARFLVFDGTTWNPAGTSQTAMWDAGFLQGTPINIPSPADSQVLLFEEGEWRAPYATTDAAWNASRLRGKNIGTSSVTTGQVLWFRGDANAWMSGPSVESPTWNASQLQGQEIDTTDPVPGQLFVYQDVAGVYKWASGPSASTPVFNAGALRGTPVSDQAPAGDLQVLEFDQGEWRSGPAVNAPVWNAGRLQGKAIATTVPSTGNVFAFRTDANAWDPRVNVDDPIWNASEMAGIDIDTQAPDPGQLFMFKDNVDGQRWAPGTHYVSEPAFAVGFLYNQPIASVEPDKEGQILVFDNGQWTPGPAISEPVWNLGRLNVKGVGSAAPSVGQALRFRGDAQVWYPRSYDPAANSYNAAFIQSMPISSVSPQDGHLLSARDNGGTLEWGPIFKPDSAVYVASHIHGIGLSVTAPLEGQSIQYNTTELLYEPGPKSSDAVWDAASLQGIPISTQSPQVGDVLTFTNNEWTPIDPSLHGYGQSVEWFDGQKAKIKDTDILQSQAREFLQKYE